MARNPLPALIALLLASMPISALAQACNTGAGVFRLGTAGAGGQVFLSAPTRGGGLSVFQSGGPGGCALAPQLQQRGSGLPIQDLLGGLTTLGNGRPPITTLLPSFGTTLNNRLGSPGGSASTRKGGDQGHHHGGGNSGQGIGNQGGNQGGGKPDGGDQGHHHGGGNSGQGGGNQGGGRPGGGIVIPPIAIRPPTGIMPGRPSGVTPPIGTLPPGTGTVPITPTVPGAVTPPIGTLPPVTGVTPGMPGGVTPPIGTLPPVTGVTPGMPGGVTPPIGTLPPVTGVTPGMPGGVTPPIGTLPPVTGVTPGMPGGVTPPIGTLPPVTGITPGMPGGVTPPIGTLPPVTGVTPGMPGGVTPPIGTLPPVTGITPGMPGGVTPPIGTLPPVTGVTPGMPGGVTPPIGTLPPVTGVTPGMPGGVTPPIGTLPPVTGVTPGMPGGVTPPIGTLPPVTGVTPGMPGGVTPPIGTLPPVTGVTPGMPGGVTPPIGTLPPVTGVTPGTAGGVVVVPGVPGTATAPVQETTLPRDGRLRPGIDCRDPRQPVTDPAVGRLPECKPDCLPAGCEAPDIEEAQMEVPLTPGRDFGVVTEWNAWSDVRSLSLHDARFGLDLSSVVRSAEFGLDRRFGSDFVAGLSFTLQNSVNGGYNGFLSSTSTGFSIGPYVAYMLSPNWAIDASLSYGRLSNKLGIAMFSGSYMSQSIGGSASLHGQYDLGVLNVRPKVSGSFTYFHSDGYAMYGSLLGQNLSVQLPSSDYNVASFTASNEFNKVFITADGTQVMPYAEFGVQYDAIRVNDGQILTGTLGYAVPSAWTMTVRSGVRMLLSNSIQIDLTGGYLSLGQSGLDVVEARLRASLSF